MAFNLQRSMCLHFILSSFILSRIYSVQSTECTEYFMVYKETSCDPVPMNYSNRNISKNPLQSSCDETTTVNEEDGIEPECRHFFTYFQVKNCDGGNSTKINPIATELEMSFHSSMSHKMFEDDLSCQFVPPKYQFEQLMCEEVTTECKPINKTTQPFVANSTQNDALIALGAISAVGVASALTYVGVIKIREILQSATYFLPN